MKTALLSGLLFLAAELLGQNSIPAGTILPLRLNSSLNSKKSNPGDIVTARLMQDVVLPSGEKIHAGSKAVGHVLEVVAAKNGGGAKLSLQFDTLEVSHRRLPMTTNLRALTSMMEVGEQRTWRNMTRMKLQLTRDRVRLQSQMECLLEEMRIKLSLVVSNLLGASGLRILRALAEGETELADRPHSGGVIFGD